MHAQLPCLLACTPYFCIHIPDTNIRTREKVCSILGSWDSGSNRTCIILPSPSSFMLSSIESWESGELQAARGGVILFILFVCVIIIFWFGFFLFARKRCKKPWLTFFSFPRASAVAVERSLLPSPPRFLPASTKRPGLLSPHTVRVERR